MINYSKASLKDNLSKHRMSLFTIAMIWIYFRHCYFFSDYSFGDIVDCLTRIGDCGVDIFLFLSGYGLYYSITKYADRLSFYKKRFSRILPSVIILLTIFAISDYAIGNTSNLIHIINPKYWIASLYWNYWYVSAILILYLLFPFINGEISKINNSIYPILISCIIGLIGIVFVKYARYDVLSQLVVYFARIPIFVMGICIAKYGFWEIKTTIMFFAISLPLIYLLPKDFQRMSYMLMVVPLMHWIPNMLNLLPTKLTLCLQIIGKCSLEFYLIHIYLLKNNLLLYFEQLSGSKILSSLVVLIIAISISLLASRIIILLTLKNTNK